MAKATKVNDLAATLNMDSQQLIEKINALGLGFSVKSKSSGLTEEQVRQVQQRVAAERQTRANTAIDAKSQSTGKGTVRIRRRRDEDVAAPEKSAAPVSASVETKRPAKDKDKEQPKAVKATAAPAPEKVQEEAKPEVVRAPEVSAPAAEAVAVSEAAAPEVPAAEVEKTEAVVASAPEVTESVPAAEDDSAAAEAQKKSAQDVKKDKKTADVKKAAKKAEKEKKKNEKIFDIAPKFEKEVSFSFGTNFADEVPEEFSAEPDDADEDEGSKWSRQSRGSKKSLPAHSTSVDDLDIETDEEESDNSHKKVARPSNITGNIDPALIRAMLVRDNKKFGGGNNDKSAKKPGSRTVVNSSQFYGNANGQQNNRNQGHNAPNKKAKGNKKNAQPAPAQHPQASEHKRIIKVSENIAISVLANDMGVKAAEIIRFLMKELGMMVTVNQTIDVETAELVATEYGFTIQDVSFKEEEFTSSTSDKPEDLELRAPIVTVMGHVDHGKTSLLDAIRKTRVTATEAGGITQHIGASTIDTPTGKVVFLDTPGHEAFTALRARGAKVTDLVVLVVAADDGVMPQTVEAINHAKAAGVPIIVAINKIDKPGANPERVRQALTEYELIPEEWGGTTIFKEVSAKTGAGVAELLELIQLQSEVLELKANPDKPARGFILEAYKDNRRGTVASILVQEGTLRINDLLVSGACYGKVKSMTNDRGKNIRVAEPSTPVEITGLSDVPEAGEPFFVAKDEKVAKEFTTQIKERKRNAELSSRKFDPWAQFKDNKQLNVIIKADVQGSLEALVKSLGSLSTEDVELQIVHAAVGGATENDVQLAVASSAIIVGFNTRPDPRAAEIAKREGVIMESFSIIYEIIDYVKNAMSGLLDPIIGENVLGHVEVRNTFNVPKVGTIAGGYVLDGIIKRGAKCRLVREGKVIYDSKIASLKRFKDDAKEVRSGFECGFSIENYNDIKVGDVAEIYEVTETKQSL